MRLTLTKGRQHVALAGSQRLLRRKRLLQSQEIIKVRE